MNLWIILAIVAVICLLNRGPSERDNTRRRSRKPETDEQFERLKSRVTVLEEILLDRDRRLRDDFRGL